MIFLKLLTFFCGRIVLPDVIIVYLNLYFRTTVIYVKFTMTVVTIKYVLFHWS